MSWNVSLECRECGSTLEELNITFNYSRFYRMYLDEGCGLRILDGKPAHRTIDLLQFAVNGLGTGGEEIPVSTTAENAGDALAILLGWAKRHPRAWWRVM